MLKEIFLEATQETKQNGQVALEAAAIVVPSIFNLPTVGDLSKRTADLKDTVKAIETSLKRVDASPMFKEIQNNFDMVYEEVKKTAKLNTEQDAELLVNCKLVEKLSSVFSSSELSRDLFLGKAVAVEDVLAAQPAVKALMEYTLKVSNDIVKVAETSESMRKGQVLDATGMLEIIQALRDIYESSSATYEVVSIKEQYRSRYTAVQTAATTPVENAITDYNQFAVKLSDIKHEAPLIADQRFFARTVGDIVKNVDKLSMVKTDDAGVQGAFAEAVKTINVYLMAFIDHLNTALTVQGALLLTSKEAKEQYRECLKEVRAGKAANVEVTYEGYEETSIDEEPEEEQLDETEMAVVKDLADVLENIENEGGVNKQTHASLEAIDSGVLGTNYPAQSFTEELSNTNLTVTTEGIAAAIGKAFKKAMEKIIKFCQRIIKFIVGIFKAKKKDKRDEDIKKGKEYAENTQNDLDELRSSFGDLKESLKGKTLNDQESLLKERVESFIANSTDIYNEYVKVGSNAYDYMFSPKASDNVSDLKEQIIRLDELTELYLKRVLSVKSIAKKFSKLPRGGTINPIEKAEDLKALGREIADERLDLGSLKDSLELTYGRTNNAKSDDGSYRGNDIILKPADIASAVVDIDNIDRTDNQAGVVGRNLVALDKNLTELKGLVVYVNDSEVASSINNAIHELSTTVNLNVKIVRIVESIRKDVHSTYRGVLRFSEKLEKMKKAVEQLSKK